jgi:hypothetical protein
MLDHVVRRAFAHVHFSLPKFAVCYRCAGAANSSKRSVGLGLVFVALFVLATVPASAQTPAAPTASFSYSPDPPRLPVPSRVDFRWTGACPADPCRFVWDHGTTGSSDNFGSASTAGFTYLFAYGEKSPRLRVIDQLGRSAVVTRRFTLQPATPPNPPPPPPVAACADGRDNDGDGRVDLNDPGCSSASDNDEANVVQPPPLTGFPTAANTGVADNWQPQSTTNGSMTIDQDGAVIENRLITGNVYIRANNITIRNSMIYGTVSNWVSGVSYNGLLLENVDLGPPSGVLRETSGIVRGYGYTARRVHVHNTVEGFRVGWESQPNRGPVVIEDSYVDLDDSGQCDHSDGIQDYGGANIRVTVNHNTIDQRGVGCETAPIYLSDPGPKSVTNNLLAGGSYTLRLHGGSYDRVSGNRIVTNTWDWGPVSLDGLSCSAIGEWADNSVVAIDSLFRVTSTVSLLNTC